MLILAVILSLGVPFSLPVSAQDIAGTGADEEPATGDDIHAFVYTALDANGNVIKHEKHDKYELIFQRGDTPPYPDRAYELHVDCFDNNQKVGSEGYKQPWYDYNYYVHRLIIKDKIAPRKMSGWFMYTKTLSDENVIGLEDNIDTSLCTSFYCTFNYGRLKNLDLRKWDMSSATTVNGMFSHQEGRGLESLNISSPNWEMPNCTNFGAFIYDSALEELDLSYLNPVKATSISSFLEENRKLRKVTFGESFSMDPINWGLNLSNAFRNDISLEELDLSSWNIGKARYCAEMFKNCSSLKSINFGNAVWGSNSSVDYARMFEGCTALETLDAKCLSGPMNSPSIFKDCSNLKELDLSCVATSTTLSTATLNGKNNIFEGCDELSRVTLGENWPQSGKGGTSVPPKASWKKIDEPNKGKPLSNEELFLQFGNSGKGEKGTWAAEAKITLNANGGLPKYQTINGVRGVEAEFDGSVVATRVGYQFDDWYSEKTGGSKLEDGQLIESWTYYAHWIENHYGLTLYGNGGETAEHDTEVSASNNLLYSEYYDLNNSIFTRDGYVLSGWNTRPNGTGDSYSANDSVNKLTAVDGGEAKLYAQWHKPDVVITFDPQEGEPVGNQNYTLKTGETVTYGDLPESTRNGYTFMGWYTTADDSGTKITANTEVGSSCTLYAHWEANPMVTFDANGGGNAFFDNNTSKTTMVKQYKYGQNLGVLPIPYFGACELDGWYTEPTGGTRIDSSTPAQGNPTYYAHWGYKPKFESNGGVYTTQTITEVFPTYQVRSSPIYRIYKTRGFDPVNPRPTLPEFTDNEGFEGWYFGSRNLSDEIAALSNNDGYIEIDVSSGDHVNAKWEIKSIYKVALDLDGGYLKAGTRNPIQVYAGNTVEELPTPTKTVGGVTYEFLGWYDAASGGNKMDYTFTPSGDCTLYARWAAKDLTLTFDAGEGALFYPDDSSLKVYNGGTVHELPGANREGYTFDGWYTDVDDESTKLTTSTPITANTTYHAKWTSAEDRFITSSDEIYRYSVKWSTPSNEYAANIDDTMILAPQNGNSEISVMLFVEFDFNQGVAAQSDPYKTLGPGTVQIKIPKYIFEDRDGNNIGSNNMENGGLKESALGTAAPDNPNRDTNFVYDKTSDPDYYILWNNYTIDGSLKQQQVFKISYSLTAEQLRVLNGGHLDENGYFAGDYYLRDKDGDDPINVFINVNQEGVAETTDYNKKLGLEYHSEVHTTAAKTQAAASFGWNSLWGPMPADADQYYYITWTLISTQDKSSSQKFSIEWSEDPVHEGSIVYTKLNDYTTDTDYSYGSFHTTIVTKHPRKSTDSGWKTVYNEAVLTVKWYSGYEEKIRVSKTAGAYLIGDGESIFDKGIKDYEESGVSRTKKGAQELILNRTGYNHLPFSIRYHEYQNLDDNKQWFEETKTYSTVERTITISDGAKGDSDVILSTVKGSYPYNWNETPTNPNSPYVGEVLGDSDYHFSAIDLYITEYDAVYLKPEESETGDWSEPYEHTEYADYDDIEVWTRAAGSNSFTLFKTVKAGDLAATIVNNPTEEQEKDAGYGIAKHTVTLPDNTVGYQIKHKSSFFATKIVVNPNLCLNASNKVFDLVRDDVADNRNTLIKNKANVTVDGRRNSNKDSRNLDINGAYPSSYELAIGESSIYVDQKCDKKDKAVTNDDEKTQTIPAVISGWGTSSSKDENDKEILKLIDSGEFYDLLPTGFTVDPSTVFIKARTKHQTAMDIGAGSYDQEYGVNNFSSGYYSVELTENWQDSGRTMMKITVDTPDDVKATGYNVFFKMKTTLANILAGGESQNNSVCFIDTTENQSPPKNKTSRISTGLNDKARPYFMELDSDYTAFANGNTACKAPNNYAFGMSSYVISDGSLMTADKTVGLNTAYSYDITFTNSTQPSKDIIIYDVIENSLTGATYDWQGEFQSVTVTDIEALRDATDTNSSKIYCAPKVWYCITDRSITKDDLDITNSEIWTDVAPTGSDKARVKAIAVDCSKNSKGGDFTLPADGTTGKSSAITFEVNMISPHSNEENDVLTYNEAHVFGKSSGEPFSNITIANIRLHFVNPEFHKTAFPTKEGEAADNRTGVVNESTIEYKLGFTNPDDHVNIHNIVVEDVLDSDLILTNTVKVQLGDENPIAINKAPRISEYAISTDNGCAKFTATISYLAPGETLTIIIPATVNAALGADIDNTATITSVNDNPADIESETTYHVVTPCQAKIKKVDVNKNAISGATLQVLNKDKSQVLHEFTSIDDVYTFNLVPGDYVLHEVSTPNNDYYKPAADIPFTIDVEGIHYVNDTPVSYVEMIDMPAYEVIFHSNQPDHDDEIFKVYGPADLNNNGGIDHFYDIPSFAGDEYVFAGWYYTSGFAESANFDSVQSTAVNFETQTYPKSDPENPQDYHLYAKWIEVGTVEQATGENGDTNNYGGIPIRGFGLAGVQIRYPGYYDSNYSVEKPGGLRFVTSLSETLYEQINALSGTRAEYGYVVGTEENIHTFVTNYNVKDPSHYKLQYKGENVNGVDTTGKTKSAETDFRYVTNVNCTSEVGGSGIVKEDHRNFNDYRLYTLVVTYEGNDAEKMDKKLDARAYIRYTDANGKERVFYNDYKKNMYYGGCLCSYNQVSTIALPSTAEASSEG